MVQADKINGLKLPQFIYGTAWKEDNTQGLVEQALRCGFRAIDTANQRKHYFETAVGAGIATILQAGEMTRDELFLQTKYTFQRGQDHRLPYDSKAPIETQVAQSFDSSLEHLQTDYVDSYILHGPSSGAGLQLADWSAWRAMEEIHSRGRAHLIGISNVSIDQLQALCEGAKVAPKFVQNRCYANRGWDKSVRQFCTANDIAYQGFSLLTANRQIHQNPTLLEIGKRHRMSISQTLFRFAIDAGMIPLTGTSNPDHMKHDLRVSGFKLSDDEVNMIEALAV